MNPLIKDLQTPKKTLGEFLDVTKRVLDYLPSVISRSYKVRGYTLLSSEVAGTKKFVRPIQNNLFIFEANRFQNQMGKIFLDKLLMERFAKHPVKVIGIFLNDVQRKGTENVSFTFVSGLFMVYTKFLCVLEGVYFLDLPPKTKEAPYNNHIFPFSKFITQDITKLLSS